MRKVEPVAPQSSVALNVSGIKCSGCASGIRLALEQLDGVDAVDVDERRGIVTVRGNGVTTERSPLIEAIESVGYRVRPDAVADEAPQRRDRALVIASVVAMFFVGTTAFVLMTRGYFRPGGIQAFNDEVAGASFAALLSALSFGLVAGFAPATYAMAPAVVSYVSQSRARSYRRGAALAGAFVAGFVAIDVVIGALLGVAGTGVLRALSERLPLTYIVAATTLLALGLINLGVIRLPGRATRKTRAPHGGGMASAFALGVPFGFLTCPACIPLMLPVALGAVGSGDPLSGAALMGLFAVGRGIPLVALGASLTTIESLRRTERVVPWVKRVMSLMAFAGAGYFLAQWVAIEGWTL